MPALLNFTSSTGGETKWKGGKGVIVAYGTFGGTSLQLQVRTPNNQWANAGAAMTAAGEQEITLPPTSIRMTVTGGTPSALYARIDPVGGRQ